MKRLSTILTAAAIAAVIPLGTAIPAKADQTSTDEIILGAAAVVAGVATYANVQHKNQLASTVQGYTPWGATVYEDGHVVLPNGQSYYPGNVGQQIACNGTSCQIYQNGVAVGYGGYGPGYGGYNNAGYNQNYNTGYYPNGQYYGSSVARSVGTPTYTVIHPAAVARTTTVVPATVVRTAVVRPAVVEPVALSRKQVVRIERTAAAANGRY